MRKSTKSGQILCDLQTNMLACAAGAAAAFVEQDIGEYKSTGGFSAYLLLHPYFRMLPPVFLAGCC